MRKLFTKNIVWIPVVSFIAFGQVYRLSEGSQTDGWVIAAEVALLTLAFIGALALIIQRLIPRLLFRSRFTAYAFALLGLAFGFAAIEMLFEYIQLTFYHKGSSPYNYFGEEGIWWLEILSSVITYYISIASTAILVLFARWKQSGQHIRDWEEQRIQKEVERTKTQIDANALFDTLDRVTAIVCQAPAEASHLLRELSRSLRQQLYENRSKQEASPDSAPAQTFNFSSPSLGFLTEQRYRTIRHLLLILVVVLINACNFDNTLPSLLLIIVLCVVFLVLIYFNIYVLIPRLLLKHRGYAYLFTLVVTTTLFIGGILLATQAGAMMIITNVVKISLFLMGITVFILIQHWIRNERRIASLQAATLRSELEQLQNQVNPHFLFNMLNNILVQIKENPVEAESTLHKLTDMLKYQFRETKQAIRLGDDIHFLSDYLNLEKLRRDNFEFSITTDNHVEETILPPLLFIPFVENAVKHNNDNQHISYVHLRFYKDEDSNLHFICTNSKPSRLINKDEVGGLGLANVSRRLDLLYGEKYSLEIKEDDSTFNVELIICD